MRQVGELVWVNGPVVRAHVSGEIHMMEQVEVSDYHLVGEVVSLEGDVATIQVYEETAGIRPGDPVYGMGMPLSVELGPGLLGHIFDGIQRPLEVLAGRSGDFILRGVRALALDRDRLWAFNPQMTPGRQIHGGETIGTVPETLLIEHRIMVPPDIAGVLGGTSGGIFCRADYCACLDRFWGEGTENVPAMACTC